MFLIRVFFALCAMSGWSLIVFGAAIAELPETHNLIIGAAMMLMGVISAIMFSHLTIRGFR